MLTGPALMLSRGRTRLSRPRRRSGRHPRTAGCPGTDLEWSARRSLPRTRARRRGVARARRDRSEILAWPHPPGFVFGFSLSPCPGVHLVASSGDRVARRFEPFRPRRVDYDLVEANRLHLGQDSDHLFKCMRVCVQLQHRLKITCPSDLAAQSQHGVDRWRTWQMERPQKRLKQTKPVAVGCDRLSRKWHGVLGGQPLVRRLLWPYAFRLRICPSRP
jgi:hypothetical protein